MVERDFAEYAESNFAATESVDVGFIDNDAGDENGVGQPKLGFEDADVVFVNSLRQSTSGRIV